MTAKPIYTYFVSYMYTLQTYVPVFQGLGMCKVERGTPIRTFDDINEICEKLKKEGALSSVIILFYNQLETE